MLKKCALLASFAASLGLLPLVLALPGIANATEVRHPTVSHETGNCMKPTGKGWGEVDVNGISCAEEQRYSYSQSPGYAKGSKGGKPGGGGNTNNGILYHGGPVMSDPINIYYIWYGPWNFSDTKSDDSKTKQVLENFAKSIGSTKYFNINNTYHDGNNNAVTKNVTLGGQTYVDSAVSSVSDADIQAIVSSAISNNGWNDPNGVYFVLTSKNITESSGFCTSYCAWHYYYGVSSSSSSVKYGFIGDPEQLCPSSCSVVNSSTAPHGSLAGDAMANLIAHELAESATDENVNAWYDHRGYENADKCAWKFGKIDTTDGTYKNVALNGDTNLAWLLQQNWINAGGGYCTLSN